MRTEMYGAPMVEVVERSAVETRVRFAYVPIGHFFGMLCAGASDEMCVLCHVLRRFECAKPMCMCVVIVV